MAPGPFDPTGGARGDAPADGIGALLTRARQERGWSQLRLAELLCAAAGTPTVTRHEISRWERAERIPSSHWLGWLAAVLEVPVTALEVAAGATRALRPPATGRDRADAAGRARAGAGRAGMTADATPVAARASPVPSGATPAAIGTAIVATGPGVTGPLGIGPRRIGPRGIGPVGVGPRVTGATGTDRIDVLRRMDDLIGGADLAGTVLAEFRGAAGRGADARTVAGASGPRAGEVAALAQLVSWVLADAGRHDESVGYGRLGLRAARSAGDRLMAAHLLGCLAESAAEAGHAATALRLARAACDRSAGAPAAAMAVALHRTGYVSALCGLRDAGELALATAERTAVSGPAEVPPWLYWLDELHLTALTGRCYAALGRPRPARALLTEALGSGGLRPRERAICGAWLGLAAVTAGDLDAAREAAGPALLAAIRSGSVRAGARVRVLDAALRRRLTGAAAARYTELSLQATGYLPAPAGGPTSAPAGWAAPGSRPAPATG
jgi:transcriptional regulator with XRE-family HTH domain